MWLLLTVTQHVVWLLSEFVKITCVGGLDVSPSQYPWYCINEGAVTLFLIWVMGFQFLLEHQSHKQSLNSCPTARINQKTSLTLE